MLPPRLRIELVDRQAVARAQRRSARGPEQGYVDRLGNWMTSRQQRGGFGGGGGGGGAAKAAAVQVLGWQERLRPALALVLKQQGQLGSSLQQVRFEPNGSLWLRTAALGNVHLGPPDQQLTRRLEVLQHLSTHLPAELKSLTVQSIDLSDPDKPELGLPGKTRARAATTTKPASSRSGSGVD